MHSSSHAYRASLVCEILGLAVLLASVCAVCPVADAQLPFKYVSPNEHHWGRFGYDVDRVPDVNDDGIEDVVVGARTEMDAAQTLTPGRAYIMDGSDESVLHELSSSHETNSCSFGVAVAGLDDVNNDGFGDVAIGAKGSP